MKLLKYLTAITIIFNISTYAHAADVIYPSVVTKEEVAGKIFDRPSMITTHNNNVTQLDVRTLLSSDKKLDTGMFQAGASRFDITEPYGVDEFMFFIKGSVKLTSSDGTVHTVNPGESVTIPKEWTGIWETEGYTKFYVIYTADAPTE